MVSPVVLLIFDGFADWEPALACAELNKSGRFSVRSAAISLDPITSMAGLKITPDLTITQVTETDAVLLIVPGGDVWESGEQQDVTVLLRSLAKSGTTIAAICGGTIAAAHAGLLDNRIHTSNFSGYLERHVPNYRGKEHFRNVPAVTDGSVITASGMGSVEFAFEVLKLLNVYGAADLELWLRIYRDKVVPQELTA